MKLGSIVNHLRLDNYSLILVKRDSEIAKDRQTFEEFGKAIERTGLTGIVCIMVDDLYGDLKAINEQTMNDLGWYKIDHLVRLMNKHKQEKELSSKSEIPNPE